AGPIGCASTTNSCASSASWASTPSIPANRPFPGWLPDESSEWMPHQRREMRFDHHDSIPLGVDSDREPEGPLPTLLPPQFRSRGAGARLSFGQARAQPLSIDEDL